MISKATIKNKQLEIINMITMMKKKRPNITIGDRTIMSNENQGQQGRNAEKRKQRAYRNKPNQAITQEHPRVYSPLQANSS